MKILVTGGCGFIGSHLVDKLIDLDHEVVVVDNLSMGKRENLNPKARFYKIDICSPEISEVFEKERPEIVFHLASQISLSRSVENPLEDAKVNILGSLNIFENCQKFKIKKIVFTSTAGVYGQTETIPTSENCPPRPLFPYSINKLTTEKYLSYYYRVFGLPYIIFRLANVYGPRQSLEGEPGVVAVFSNKILKGEQPVINGDGKQTRDFIYVKDVVGAAILAIESKKSGIYNIGTGKETEINQLFRKIQYLAGSSIEAIYGPEKVGEQRRSSLDCSRAKEELGWEPKYNLEQGLKETIKWFQNHYEKH
jgi:UDP-glucose 4-epimerase